MKRQLNKIEREICKRQIRRMEDRNNYLDYLEEYDNIMISKGLYQNYMHQLQKYKDDLDEIKKEIKLNDQKIRVLLQQIKEGVEVKKKKAEDNKLIG